jgi:hypothetical protein
MIRTLLPPLTALAICAFGISAAAAPVEPPAPPAMAMEQHWAADHAAMLDASIAGLRAGLKLNPDQEKLWPSFETAVRDAAKLRMDQMKAVMDHAQERHDAAPDADHPGPAFSPVDRLDAIAQRMADRGAALKKVADAAKPLYASLEDSQKRLFSLLGGDMLLSPQGHHGMSMMGHRDMMGDGGRSMMRHDEDGDDENDDDEDGDDED